MMKLEECKNPHFSTLQHPWLLIRHGHDKQKHTFYSVSEKRCGDERSIPELQNKMIRAYAHEWLVLEDTHSNDCYLWNSISNDKIQLPLIPEYCRITKCLLSAPPHEPECLVLFLIKETTPDDKNPNDDKDVDTPTLYFCKPGYNHEFHKQDLQSIVGDDITFDLWTVFKRKIYVLTWQTCILLRLDPDNDSGTITVTPMTNQPPDFRIYLEMPRCQNFLIQSSCDDNDMLLYVHKVFNGKDNALLPYDFLVFRFDFVKKAWVKMESIEEIAIFLNGVSSATCSTRGTNLNRESIYFTQGRYLCIFNKKTGISFSLPSSLVSKRNTLMYWLTLPF